MYSSNNYPPIDDYSWIPQKSFPWIKVIFFALLGASIACGGLYIYFKGQQKIEVPALVGVSLNQAKTLATKHHLGIAIVGHAPDVLVPKGAIISQEPLAKQHLTRHSSIVVKLSLGAPKQRESTPTTAKTTL